MRVLITTEQIQKRVTEMACVIESDFRGRPLTIVGVLTGSLMSSPTWYADSMCRCGSG